MKYGRLVLSVGVCLLAGIVGSIFTINAIPTWYASLQKPAFNPPNFVFGPVWTFLYILMGVSIYLVWQKKGGNKSRATYLFLGQLVLNTLWSVVFFGFKSPFLGLLVIFILWFLILLTIIEFYRLSKVASYLLMPYILWVSFASILNFSIYLLNG